MHRVAVGAVHVAIAAGLMRAGVAFACPTPPDECSEAMDLAVKISPAVEVTTPDHGFVVTVPSANGWCDKMALFTLDNVSVSLPGSGEDSTEDSGSLTDVRIVRVASTAAPAPGKARFGSAAFCVWAAETGYSQKYAVTVQARDAQGKPHRGVAKVEIVCGQLAEGEGTPPATDPKSCDPRCVEEVPPPCTQCQCNADGGGPAGGDSDGGDSKSQMLTGASAKQTAGSCAAFPGAGSGGALVLGMLGTGLALRRRR